MLVPIVVTCQGTALPLQGSIARVRSVALAHPLRRARSIHGNGRAPSSCPMEASNRGGNDSQTLKIARSSQYNRDNLQTKW